MGWEKVPLFWRFQLAGWLAFEVLSFPLKLIVLGTFEAAVMAAVFRDGAAFLLTVAMRSVYRRTYGDQTTITGIVTVLFPTCIAAGLLLTVVSLALERVGVLEHEALFGRMAVLRLFYFCTSLFAGWSFLYFGIKMMSDINERRIRLVQIEAAKKEAELKVLRTQMSPHFLFNALNTIRAGIDERSQVPLKLIEALSGYLRYSLAHRDDNFVSAQKEFEALTDYLAVEKARFRDDLELEWHIDDVVMTLDIPSFLIQPLVENAVKYGRQTSPRPLRVEILAAVEGDILQMTVANTGRWGKSSHEEPEHGLALQNLRQRLKILYPNRQTFEVAAENGWVRVSLRIPIGKNP